MYVQSCILISVTTSRDWRAKRNPEASEVELTIFAATSRLLQHESLSELSVAQIVKEAGVSRTTFYYYFTSKHAVIAALMTRVLDDMNEPFEPLYAAASASGEPIHDWHPLLEGLVRIWDDHGPILGAAILHWHELPALHDAWLTNTERAAQLLAGLIDHQRTLGIAHPGMESIRLARTVVGAMQYAWQMATYGGKAGIADLVEVSEPIFEMLSATLYGLEPS